MYLMGFWAICVYTRSKVKTSTITRVRTTVSLYHHSYHLTHHVMCEETAVHEGNQSVDLHSFYMRAGFELHWEIFRFLSRENCGKIIPNESAFLTKLRCTIHTTGKTVKYFFDNIETYLNKPLTSSTICFSLKYASAGGNFSSSTSLSIFE